jgi:uncharacterized membrane protein required for colicin V production
MNITSTFGIGIIDLVIILAVILFMILGWKHGFLLKIVEMASGVFGLIGSILLARPFSTVLDKWIGAAVSTKINEYLVSRLSDLPPNFTEQALRTSLEGMSLPQFMVDWIVKGIDFSSMTNTIFDTITPVIQSLALLVIAFITLFFGSMILFFFLKILAKMITSIPIIREADKILGVLFGIVKIAAIVYILLFILALLITIPGINDLIGGFLEHDMQLTNPDQFRISKWLYDNNVLKQVIDVFI